MNKIKITFPDNSVREFDQGITAFDVAKSISNRLAEDALVCKINDIEKELSTKIEQDSKLQLFTFDSPVGQKTYWHSTSHLMAHAVQSIYPEAKFGVGPAIDAGFYYDIDINTTLTETDLEKIEKRMI